MFVKLALEWEMFHDDLRLYLSNVLTGKLYEVDESYKRNILEEIEKGANVSTLTSKYGKRWEAFKNELMKNKAIVFSNFKNGYKDKIAYGSKLMSSSSFLKEKVSIDRITIEINNFCSENCSFCSKDNPFPCFSCCSLKGKKDEISKQVVDKFLNDTKNIEIREVMLTGGQIFDSIDILKYLIDKLENRREVPAIYLITNGILKNKENIEWIINNNIIPIINIISNQSTYINELKNFLADFDKSNIPYLLLGRQESKLQKEFSVLVNYEIKHLISIQKTIINQNNLVRSCTIPINSYSDIRNLCIYGKILLHIDGTIGICKEYDHVYGNILEENTLQVILRLHESWNQAYSIKKCFQCQFRKICNNCQGLLKKYEYSSSLCFLDADK